MVEIIVKDLLLVLLPAAAFYLTRRYGGPR